MTPEDFDTLFDRFHRTAYKLETLDTYDVGDIGNEAARMRAIRGGLPVPERSVRTDPWLARIARTTIVDGKVWRRVRLVSTPLTEYERLELVSLVEAQAVGDENFIAQRSAVEPAQDMWLFDAGTTYARAVLMEYDAHGRWLGFKLVTRVSEVEPLEAAWERALAAAVPLNVFLAQAGHERARVGSA